MGALLTAPASFVANTRARASEVNAKMTTIAEAIRGGSNDVYTNGYRLSRVSNGNTTISGNDCVMLGFYEVGTDLTYDLATSTARLSCSTVMKVNTGATLHIATGAIARVF